MLKCIWREDRRGFWRELEENMISQTELMKISDVRATVARIIHEESVPRDVVQTARDSFQTICWEAAGHGLTTADVVRAVLRPVFERKRNCECPTCRARRNEPYEGESQPRGVPAA